MTDTAKNSAAAEEGVYETPEDIAAEAAKPAERAARTDADSPIAPVDPFEPDSLGWLLPWAETGEGDVLTPDEALEVFLEWVDARGMELWPHQEDALMDLAVGDSVILGTPTGSGKSMVALGLCFMAVATGRVAYYTAPIKALVSEKFFDMVDILGRENVGMITGDTTINTEAPVICCTAEILANQALREGPASKVACVVMDEFHFYADPDRGWAWQVPLLTLPNAQFLLMSATLGDVTDIASALEERTGRPVDLVTDAPRPVPLSYDYTFETLEATVELGLRAGEAPMYIVHFSQDEALKNARALASYGVSDKAQREAIKQAMKGTKFTTPFGKILQRLLWRVPHRKAGMRAWACTTRACCRATGCWWSASPSRGSCRSSAAPTRSVSASTCPSTPWCSRSSPSSTAPRCAACVRASSTRSWAGRGGPGSTPRAWWWRSPPSTRSRTTRQCSRPATTRRSSAA